jgi:cellulose synthase/poly-beta-1,6-N-acetylglucosamine synthase-like glycosyltransferase
MTMTFLLLGPYLFVLLLMFVVAVTTLAWMLYTWNTPDSMEGTRFPRPLPPRFSFSLLVPAYKEEHVLARTLERLASQRHPDVEILPIVRSDDPGTAAVAYELQARFPDRIRVIEGNYTPKNKPAAMNMALPKCRGDVLGIFDAEDVVHEALLENVDTLFQTSEATVVQSGVQLMNFWSNWFAARNVLEYYFYFRSRLHYHAKAGFIPLGGNTVFIRRAVMERFDGWDENCLAEDCDLGVRISSEGHSVAVAYEPELVTREETPATLDGFIKQRTRWNQGFLQVLRKGYWKRLPTRPQRLLAIYTLAMPFFQALTALLLPVAVFMILFVDLPLAIALLTFVPIIPLVLTVCLEVGALHEFGKEFGYRVRPRDYARLVLGAPMYQLVLLYAAVRAVVRHLRHEASWEKTDHLGAHMTSESHQVAEA